MHHRPPGARQCTPCTPRNSWCTLAYAQGTAVDNRRTVCGVQPERTGYSGVHLASTGMHSTCHGAHNRTDERPAGAHSCALAVHQWMPYAGCMPLYAEYGVHTALLRCTVAHTRVPRCAAVAAGVGCASVHVRCTPLYTWCTPTYAECRALYNKCMPTWRTLSYARCTVYSGRRVSHAIRWGCRCTPLFVRCTLVVPGVCRCAPGVEKRTLGGAGVHGTTPGVQ